MTTPNATTHRYPVTRTCDHVDNYHGIDVADPYRWLEDLNSPETQAWIEAQNALTYGYLDQIPDRDPIFNRLQALWDYPKMGAPFKRGGRYFQFRNSGLQNQDVLYVMADATDVGTVLIDPNALSQDGTVALTGIGVSWDGNWIAYATSASGSDWKTWHVRSVPTGEDLSEAIEWSKFSGVAWLPDSSGFLYGRYAAPAAGTEFAGANYNQQLYLHRLDTPQNADVLVYERPDHPKWGFDPIVTDDGAFLVLLIWEGTDRRNLVFYKRIGDQDFTELIATFDARYEFLGNSDTTFYFHSDLRAPKGQILAIDLARPASEHWETRVPESEDTLEWATMAHGEFVTVYLHDAYHQLQRFALDGTPRGAIPLPTLGSVGVLQGRPEDSELFYTFSSFTFPSTVFRYDLETGESLEIARPDVIFDASRYVTEQVFVKSRDGTRVPMFLVHRADWVKDGQNPTLLYGYGGFNIATKPGFDVGRLVWLEMGGVLAVANLRGGGEYGEAWHEAGTRLNKQNVFDDFIAAAEWLIENNYTRPEKLAIRGGSNGGLLVAACMLQRPDLYGAVVCQVPVIDMLRYHRFTAGRFWIPEYGNAEASREEFDYLYAYSPLHNVETGVGYPAILITSADTDDRVVPLHAKKFAATLQEKAGGDNPMLLRVETKAGHGGGKPVSKAIEEQADIYAFLFEALGMHTD